MSTQLLRKRALRPALGVLAAGALALGCGSKTSAPADAMSAIPSSLNAAAPILNSLGATVPGLSTAQQILAAGSMFGLAKQKMPADQYAEVANNVPGADALANEAVKQGLPSNVNGLSGLTEFLGKSGISPDQVTKLIPALGSALQGKVSPEVANSFMNALR